MGHIGRHKKAGGVQVMPMQWGDLWLFAGVAVLLFFVERYDNWTWRREMRRKGGRSGYKKAVR